MKKLLAAVTSIVMSASFVTSAFASSFNVSAAGGVSAVQPNVSMGEVIDGAADKNAVQNDFVVTGTTLEYNLGDAYTDAYIDFKVESGGHKGSTLVFEVDDLPAGITYSMTEKKNLAIPGKPTWSLNNKTYNCECRDASEDPQNFIDGEIICTLTLDIPSNISAGEYDINLSRFHVVEQGSQKVGKTVEFDAKVVPGKVIIKGDGTGDDTNPPSDDNNDDDNNNNSSDVMSDFVVTGSTLTYNEGDDYSKDPYIDFTVESGGHKGATLVFDVASLPAGIKYSMTEKKNLAIPGKPTWSINGSTYNCECRDASEDPQNFIDGNIVCTLTLDIPEDIAVGEYDIDLSRFHVVEQGSQKVGKTVEFDAKVVPGKLVIKDGGSTDSEQNSTVDSDTTTPDDFSINGSTLTYTKGDDYSVDPYIDFVVDAGGHKASTITFEIAELPSGITAEVTEKKNYAIDGNPNWILSGSTYRCECRDASEDPQSFKDGATVVTLTLDIPSTIAVGEYDIDLSRFHVVEQGSEVMGKIIEFDAKVNPGKLIIKEAGSTDPAAGEATWVIDTVKGTPGKSVEVPVFVKGDSTLEVAGATFEIAADGADFNKVSANSAAYGNAAITNNAATNEFAFAQAKGQGSAAADKAVIMTITYDVPADAKGTIPVEWANVTVSDTNGNLITSKVKVEDGAIIIDEEDDDDSADGEAVWVIDTVKGTPGKSVEVPVFVKGDSTLEVAGATFEIAANGADFNKVAGPCAAYGNAAITNNAATNEFAFAQAKGQGSAAADKAVIMVLTYDVPANATGTIPVEWANVTVSDTNGNLITSKVKVTNGAIVIDDEPDEGDEITWVIDTVKGTPGTTVDVPVYVKGSGKVEVAGATFEITADDFVTLSKVSGNCAAYGNAPIVNNMETNEFAFAQADGKGSAAADEAVIMVLSYYIPEPEVEGTMIGGRIPIEWSNVTVSDTNGNIITDNIKLENGAIEFGEPDLGGVADDATWVIDTVEGTPGQSVEVPVYVDGNSSLEVAGATFTINSEAGFNSVSGSCAAYGNAAIVNNAATSEYAFAQADGKGSGAADQAVIMVITYDVPADATGTIPVEWANVTVSDTNGKLITEKVELVNGAIIIKTPTTTTVSDDESDDVTTTTTVSEDVPTPTTASDDEPVDVTTTVSEDVQDTTTTTKPDEPDEDEVLWVIDTVKGTPGKPVEVPVFVSGNSALEVAGASFTINAEAGFNSVSGSCAAYGNAAIVNNAATSEYAFAQADGKGSAAADQAVIMVITYDVPEDATGTIPVTWANVTVSDTNGNLITEKVKLENGAIIIDVPTSTTEPTPTTTVTTVTDDEAKPTTTVTTVTDDEAKPTTTTTIVTDDEAKPTTTTTTVTDDEAKPTTTSTTVSDDEDKPTTTSTTVTDDEAKPTTTTTTVTDDEAKPTTTTTTVTDDEAKPTTTTTTVTDDEAKPTTTTTTVTVGEDDPTPTTTVSVQKGAIIWQGETVTAAPGEEVTLSFVVNDPNGSKLAIGGAQFVIDADGNVKYVGSTGNSEAYGAAYQENPDTMEFAFANAKGTATVGPDGSSVITLTFQVPEDAKAGDVYEVGMSGLNVSDANGNDITDKVIVINGKIQVVASVTTTTTTVTDDEAKPTTTTTTVTDDEAKPTTTTTTVTDDEAKPTTTTTTVTDDEAKPTTTTTTVTDDEAKPTTTTTTVTDDEAKPTTTTTTVTDDEAKPTTTTTTITDDEAKPTTTTTTVTDDEAKPTTTSTTVTDDEAKPTTTTTTVTDDQDDPTPTTTTTSDNGAVGPGDVTTSTTEDNYIVIPPDESTTVAVVDGFFFSHDPRPFPAEMVIAEYVLEGGQMVALDLSKITFADTVNGGGTPMEAYRESETDFTYELNVFYNGEPLYYEDGTQVVATAYIGVKGDSDLDNVVNASDASNALVFYAKTQTGGVASEIRLTPASNAIVNAHPELDELGAFLVDVDKDCYDKNNWATTKGGRTINANDASWVLKFYANESTGMAGQAYENWKNTLGEWYGESFEDYKANGTLIG